MNMKQILTSSSGFGAEPHVACIREHREPLINLKWHKETIQAMLGCYESLNTKKIARI